MKLQSYPHHSSTAAPVELIIQAKALASEEHLETAEALTVLCRRRPELYEQYRAKLGLRDAPPVVQARQTDALEQHGFVVQAKAVAHREGIDVAAAAESVAAQNPALYQRYREELFH